MCHYVHPLAPAWRRRRGGNGYFGSHFSRSGVHKDGIARSYILSPPTLSLYFEYNRAPRSLSPAAVAKRRLMSRAFPPPPPLCFFPSAFPGSHKCSPFFTLRFSLTFLPSRTTSGEIPDSPRSWASLKTAQDKVLQCWRKNHQACSSSLAVCAVQCAA